MGVQGHRSVDLDFVPTILNISQKMLKFAAANEPASIYIYIYMYVCISLFLSLCLSYSHSLYLFFILSLSLSLSLSFSLYLLPSLPLYPSLYFRFHSLSLSLEGSATELCFSVSLSLSLCRCCSFSLSTWLIRQRLDGPQNWNAPQKRARNDHEPVQTKILRSGNLKGRVFLTPDPYDKLEKRKKFQCPLQISNLGNFRQILAISGNWRRFCGCQNKTEDCTPSADVKKRTWRLQPEIADFCRLLGPNVLKE